MPDDAALDAINAAVARLLRLNASRSAFARSSEAAGARMSHPGFLLLRAVIESGPLSMGDLAELVNMDGGTAARQISRLVESGLVERLLDPTDGRISLISATPEGLAAGTAIREVRLRHLRASLDDWSDREVRALAKLLPRFVDGMAARSYEGSGEDERGVGRSEAG